MKAFHQVKITHLSDVVILFLLLFPLLSACSAFQNGEVSPLPVTTATSTPIPSPTPMAADVKELFGRLWLLSSYGQEDQPSAVPAGQNLTLTFEPDGSLIGRSPCNSYKANFQAGANQTNAGNLIITSLLSSSVLCETYQDIETGYFNGLQGAESFVITEDGRLEIGYNTTSAFQEKLVFTQGQLPLRDTLWRLENFGSPGLEVQAATGSPITAVFTSQGQLIGFSGCNAYSAGYLADDGGGMTVAETISTDLNCPLGMVQEIQYLTAIGQAESYLQQGAQLEIVYNSGEGILTFTALKTPLERTMWGLIAVNGAPPDPAAPMSLQFVPTEQPVAGNIGGLIGCNNFLADFNIGESSLSIQNMIIGGRACPVESQSMVEIYKTALTTTPTLHQIGDRLIIDSPVAQLVFSSVHDSLGGANWQLYSLGQVSNLSSASPNSEYHLQFRPDSSAGAGMLRGSSGCNSYSANYTVSPGALTVQTPELTQNSDCETDLLDQERQYLSGLTAARSYRVFGNLLVIPYTRDTVLNHIATLAPLAEQIDLTPLHNTFWFLRSVDGRSPRSTALITAIFTVNSDGLSGKVSGSTGCNFYQGSILQDFTFAPLEVGQNVCDSPPQVMAQEADFLNMLQKASSFTVEDQQLTLGTTAGPIVFSDNPPFPPPDPSILLVGRTWHLVAIDEQPVAQDSRPTVLFAADGALNGFSGCNLYSARYAVNRLALQTTPIVKTEETCQELLAVQEADFLNILGTATEYEATPTTLIVFSPAGQLSFSNLPTEPSDPPANE